MQNFNKFNDSDYISDAPDKLNGNFQTIASDFAGTSFPTTDLVEGMICHRTDEGKVYRYRGNSWQLEYTIVDGGIKVKEADGATNDANGKAITGYVTKVEVGSQQGKIKVTDGAGKSTEFTSYAFATQAEAEAGADNTKAMTPLRTKNAIDKNCPIKTFNTIESLGLDKQTVTWQMIYSKLPSSSELLVAFNSKDAPLLDTPYNGWMRFEVVKISIGYAVVYGYYWETEITHIAFFDENEFLGWKQVATNGALSMPSGNKITVNVTITDGHGYYTAPADGWFTADLVADDNGFITGGVYNQASDIWSFVANLKANEFECLVPVAKGQVCAVRLLSGSVYDAHFIYAQSEV